MRFEIGLDYLLIKNKSIMEFNEALKIVTDNIRNNPESWSGYRANIAMAFKDEYNRSNKKYKNRDDIHRIANNAANNFLICWVSDITKHKYHNLIEMDK